MYHRVRRKMSLRIRYGLILLSYLSLVLSKSIDIKRGFGTDLDDIDNDIVDFDDEYYFKYNKKLGMTPWSANDYHKDSYKYTIVNHEVTESMKTKNKTEEDRRKDLNKNDTSINLQAILQEKTTELSVIPLELLSTTDIPVEVESTTEDLTVIPLSTEKVPTKITINQTVTVPASTEMSEDFNLTTGFFELTTKPYLNETTTDPEKNVTEEVTTNPIHETAELPSSKEAAHKRESKNIKEIDDSEESIDTNEDVPIFTELDTEDVEEVPEDYYDSKDVVPTSAPKTDALSVLFGFAGSVVGSVMETVAERVMPKGLMDLFKRMQKQNEALEAEKLRSREENGGIGQFTRGVIKSISSGLSKPLTQLMAGARDNGSLDSDHGFVSSLASGVSSVANVANSMVDLFKDRVQAIYPGTVWCGDGRSSSARSGELGLFFFTDTCCRQHDACKLYILAGETKFGLTNTGLFTRSHCSCDAKFRSCLQRTNSLVSSQIGLTYFNVLGPQCFRRAHPIVRCVRRTRITGQRCEEYELDVTKPKMWQWFDNETF
ncbi:uncharacterized protein LOC121728551 [Aricia agestis]|uniref:uncharacterized protein LOC121728551 n=1 Tax=Aricia agestis TaxID=91739 RepID=UPI001C203178|nr:uncharacterized protein LOC121728551 [Aricia agestis]